MKKTAYALALAAGLAAIPSAVSAEEFWTPHLSGAQGGIATGHLPAEGVYFINTSDYVSVDVYGPNSKNTGTKITGIVDIPEIAWITPWKILGADYGVAILQPWDHADLTAPVGQYGGALPSIYGQTPSLSKSGMYATMLTPAFLSWHLPEHFFFAFRTDVWIPDGGYKNPLTGGHGIAGHLNALDFYSIQPSVALSWLNDGWNFSAKVLMDGNFGNQDNNYRSGSSVSSELTATKTIGKWTTGLTGYTKTQIQNDGGKDYPTFVAAGMSAPNGNKDHEYALGPFVGYNFGTIAINGWVDHSLSSKNTIGGDQFFTRIVIPLY